MTATWLLRGCPACGGDGVWSDEDDCYKCFACGRTVGTELAPGPIAIGKRPYRRSGTSAEKEEG